MASWSFEPDPLTRSYQLILQGVSGGKRYSINHCVQAEELAMSRCSMQQLHVAIDALMRGWSRTIGALEALPLLEMRHAMDALWPQFAREVVHVIGTGEIPAERVSTHQHRQDPGTVTIDPGLSVGQYSEVARRLSMEIDREILQSFSGTFRPTAPFRTAEQVAAAQAKADAQAKPMLKQRPGTRPRSYCCAT